MGQCPFLAQSGHAETCLPDSGLWPSEHAGVVATLTLRSRGNAD